MPYFIYSYLIHCNQYLTKELMINFSENFQKNNWNNIFQFFILLCSMLCILIFALVDLSLPFTKFLLGIKTWIQILLCFLKPKKWWVPLLNHVIRMSFRIWFSKYSVKILTTLKTDLSGIMINILKGKILFWSLNFIKSLFFVPKL